MQGDSCCREDKKKKSQPELQGAFGTKKHKLFKVERTILKASAIGCAACQPLWGSLPCHPGPSKLRIIKR